MGNLFTSDTMEYPFLIDEKTVDFISRSKTVFFLRGLPGSGRTTLAEAILKNYEGKAVICSPQDHLPEGEKPPFSKEILEECIEKYCKEGKPVVIVDDTNLTLLELEKYGIIAHRFNYMEILPQLKTAGCTNTQELAQQSKQGFTKAPAYPLFYGWFINNPDSVGLRVTGKSYYENCLKNEKFCEEFTQFLLDKGGKTPDVHHYFSSEDYDVGPVMLHCTTFFSDRGKKAESAIYADRAAVKSDTGKAFSLDVIGLLITPRSLGFRLKLGKGELRLWYEDDEGSTAPATELSSFDSDDCCGITPLSPTCGEGSRAHLSLGSGPGVDPVQTGLDLIDIIKLEQKALEDETVYKCKIQLGGAEACCYGNGNWMVYFDEPTSVSSLFSAFY